MGITTIVVTVLISVVVYSLLAFTAGNSRGCCNKLSDKEGSGKVNSCCGNKDK